MCCGVDLASRADPDRGQLVGHLAGAGRHAEPQRLAHQGGRRVFDPLERGLHRRVLHVAAARLAAQGEMQAQDAARRSAQESQSSAEGAPAGQSAGPQSADRQSHHGRVRRRLHGHVQRHHSRPSAQSHRRVQGTAQPIGPVLRNDARQRRRGPRRPPLDGRPRHEVRHRAATRAKT